MIQQPTKMIMVMVAGALQMLLWTMFMFTLYMCR